jgi:hypothetical protein
MLASCFGPAARSACAAAATCVSAGVAGARLTVPFAEMAATASQLRPQPLVTPLGRLGCSAVQVHTISMVTACGCWTVLDARALIRRGISLAAVSWHSGRGDPLRRVRNRHS